LNEIDFVLCHEAGDQPFTILTDYPELLTKALDAIVVRLGFHSNNKVLELTCYV
jgi:hypothetical protein